MKITKISWIAAVAALGLVAVSCDDVINITPTDRFSSEVVWGSRDALDHNVYNFYAYLRYATETTDAAGFTDAYSDLVKSSSWNQYNHSFNYVLLQESMFSSSDAGVFECWSTNYTRIKRTNEFLIEARNHMSDHLGAEWLTPRIAEVRFMRALNYFQLIRIYGGVVIRSDEDGLDGPDQNDKARATEAECWDLVLADLKYAAENLPVSPLASGRISKAGAYGYMSRAALWAKKYQLAVDAADSCAKYGGALDASYANVFEDKSSKENLITITYSVSGESGLTHRGDTYFRPIGDSPAHSNATLFGAFGPTSEYVDEFEMADGSAFDWAVNGANPYTGREPRFYASVLYNDALWEGRRLQLYEGGTDARADFNRALAAGSTTTGYYFRKFITENQAGWEKNGSSHFGIFLRYAEVVLNKAEALAQLGRLADAADVLNEVRTRVGLPAVAPSDLDSFMAAVRHERIVELGGEGFRYWDLRRWRLAEEVINGKVAHGVNVTLNGDGSFSYAQIDVDGAAQGTRVFPERYYLFSIPVSERSNNALINDTDNNPGW